MSKYNKAAYAAAVGAIAVIVEAVSDIEIAAAVQAAIVTLIVFIVPNAE